MQPGDSDQLPIFLVAIVVSTDAPDPPKKRAPCTVIFMSLGIFPFPAPIPSDTLSTERRLFSRQNDEALDGNAPEDS